jgi:hypothetical protein
MAGLNSGQVRIAGTGRLLKAPLGTVLPVDSVAAWGSGFVDLGYADDGFEMKQDLKRKEVNGWQTLELLRLITTALNRSFTFNLKQTNKDTLALAWGGAAITPTPGVSLGTVAVAITTGVLTVSASETLAVGDMVQLGTMTNAAPLVAGTTYFVLTVPTSTTLTLAATLGGAMIVTTAAGSSTSITKVTGAYTLAIPDASQIADFIIGIDWSDGSAVSQRLVIQRAALLSLPTVKSGRQAEIDYVVEVQALKPADNTASVLVYGVDVAVGS